MPPEYEIYHVVLGKRENTSQDNETLNTLNQENHKLFGLGFMETIASARLDFLKGVFLVKSLG